MANEKTPKKLAVIDPVYQKFTRSVIRALGSNSFYTFFMDSISKADNEIQFSNRRMEKTVDETWVDAIENTLNAFQNIISAPRHVIRDEELIVNVANAKKGGADVVQHLAMHAQMVDNYDHDTGDIRPNRLMQKLREDSFGLYENRLVFTVLENAYQFVRIRHDALFSAMSDEFGAKLKLRSDMDSATESVHMDLFLHIKDTDSALETDEKNGEIFSRISRLYRVLTVLMHTPFAEDMAKLARVKGTITKTNVLKRNPDYKKIVQLWDFLHNYRDIGYTIRVTEQNPEINQQFQTDIYHNILFNYLILKGYLENERDRRLPAPARERKRALKPKFIKQIIEELTEDYDLPDVEIRKVLIEELTKEQLMHEEALERRRLVEEQARRKKEEEERIRQEKAAQKEKERQAREAEKERLRQEKAAEEARKHAEAMERQAEDRRRSKLLRKELDRFQQRLAAQLEERKKFTQIQAEKAEDFADAAAILEATEQRKKEAAEREKKRKQEAREEKLRLEAIAKQQKLAEEERVKQEQLRAQEEQLRLQEEAEAKLQEERQEIASIVVAPYRREVLHFIENLDVRIVDRSLQKEREQQIRMEHEQARQRRREAKAAKV